MSIKSTPGMWRVRHFEDDGQMRPAQFVRVYGPPLEGGVDSNWIADCGYGANCIANAYIIAAAPELLEACKMALTELNDLRPPNVKAMTVEGCQNPNVAERLRAAIFMAEGRDL